MVFYDRKYFTLAIKLDNLYLFIYYYNNRAELGQNGRPFWNYLFVKNQKKQNNFICFSLNILI